MTNDELSKLRFVLQTSPELEDEEIEELWGLIDAEIDRRNNQTDMIPMSIHESVCASAYSKLMDECEKHRWIPVSERLPDEEDGNRDGEVLAWNSYYKWIAVNRWDECKREGKTTYWMPLPEPPEKVEPQ